MNTYAAPQMQMASLFGGSSNAQASRGPGGEEYARTSAMFGNMSQAPLGRGGAERRQGQSMDARAYEEREEESDEMGFGLFGDLDDGPRPLLFEEGAWEESGMTTVRIAFYFVFYLRHFQTSTGHIQCLDY